MKEEITNVFLNGAKSLSKIFRHPKSFLFSFQIVDQENIVIVGLKRNQGWGDGVQVVGFNRLSTVFTRENMFVDDISKDIMTIALENNEKTMKNSSNHMKSIH